MKKFVHLTNRPELSFGMRTENINGKRNYVTPSGELYPSITTILGEFSKASIQEWRKRVGETEANKISGKASRRGTRLHSVCEKYIQNEDGFLDAEPYNIIELFKTIEPFLERIDNVHGVELALYSDYFAQGAFYGVAYEELTKIPVSQVVIVIAVDDEYPQLFVEKRDDWIDKIWEAKKLYELNNIDTVDISG